MGVLPRRHVPLCHGPIAARSQQPAAIGQKASGRNACRVPFERGDLPSRCWLPTVCRRQRRRRRTTAAVGRNGHGRNGSPVPAAELLVGKQMRPRRFSLGIQIPQRNAQPRLAAVGRRRVVSRFYSGPGCLVCLGPPGQNVLRIARNRRGRRAACPLDRAKLRTGDASQIRTVSSPLAVNSQRPR